MCNDDISNYNSKISDLGYLTHVIVSSSHGSPIIGYSFMRIKHLREILTGSPPVGALNTGGV